MKTISSPSTHCFLEGYELNTTAGFRPAISAHHDPIHDITVGKEQIVSGIFYSRSVLSRFTLSLKVI